MVKPVHLYELAGFKCLKMMSEISRLNFMNINAYKFGQPATLASKYCSPLNSVKMSGLPEHHLPT